MEVLIAIFFVLYLVSHCSCSRIREAAINLYTFNVMDYGAIGDGLTDDSQVNHFVRLFCLKLNNLFFGEVH